MDKDRLVTLDYASPDPAGGDERLSIFALVCFSLAIVTFPMAMVGIFVPADVFNSVDLRYRAAFWTDVSGIPALLALALNFVAAYRIKHNQLGGINFVWAGIAISALWVIGALLGLGVFGID